MTIQQANQHREVIKWWADNPGRGLWLRIEPGMWINTTKPDFTEYEAYVIADDLAVFRKAFADGEVVQCKVDEGEFEDAPSPSFYQYSGLTWRIKPTPIFKLGDWVRHPAGYTFQVTDEDIGKLTDEFILWEPIEGRWCVFYDDERSRYLAATFSHARPSTRYPYTDSNDSSWGHVAPIEALPKLIKGQA